MRDGKYGPFGEAPNVVARRAEPGMPACQLRPDAWGCVPFYKPHCSTSAAPPPTRLPSISFACSSRRCFERRGTRGTNFSLTLSSRTVFLDQTTKIVHATPSRCYVTLPLAGTRGLIRVQRPLQIPTVDKATRGALRRVGVLAGIVLGLLGRAHAQPVDAHWDPQFGANGLNDYAYAMVPAADGSVYVGGEFTEAGGTPANGVAWWDGAAWHALGDGVDGEVHALAFGPDGTLYVGGNFDTAGGKPASHVAMW